MVDKRRKPRKGCKVRATIRSGANECKAYVVDLNEFGVRLLMENAAKSISEGDEIEIKSPELGLLRGKARWRSSHRIGIELSENDGARSLVQASQEGSSRRVQKLIAQDDKIAADLIRIAARPEMFSKAEMADLMKRAAQKIERDEATLKSLREILAEAIFVGRDPNADESDRRPKHALGGGELPA